MGSDHRDETQLTFLPKGQLGSHWVGVGGGVSAWEVKSPVVLPFLQQASSNDPPNPSLVL